MGEFRDRIAHEFGFAERTRSNFLRCAALPLAGDEPMLTGRATRPLICKNLELSFGAGIDPKRSATSSRLPGTQPPVGTMAARDRPRQVRGLMRRRRLRGAFAAYALVRSSAALQRLSL